MLKHNEKLRTLKSTAIEDSLGIKRKLLLLLLDPASSTKIIFTSKKSYKKQVSSVVQKR